MILNEICSEIRNYFTPPENIITGDFAIVNGSVMPSISLLDNQYYRIVGSVFNDGVHRKDDLLTDEPSFHGGIWIMKIPQDILQLAEEIEAWQETNDNLIKSPYMSESFGGYSYSKGSNYDGTMGVTWKNQVDFAKRLNKYRKARIL